MASTRNKNSKEDYNLEKYRNRNFVDYQEYKYSRHNYDPKYPGFGLTPTQMAGKDISHNYVTIESQLWGIGASDLENKREQQTPDNKALNEHTIIDKTPVLLPDPLVVQKYQRHLP
jgi:hypothetical protein